MRNILLALSLVTTASLAFADDDAPAKPSVVRPAPAREFTPLMPTPDMAGWHVRKPEAKSYWRVVNGIVFNNVSTNEHGVDLVTDKKFWNFTIRYEYIVRDGSNSGLYLRGRHELQILGDFKRGKPDLHGDGSIYGIKAPDSYSTNPPGLWNTVEATIIGNKVTVFLNGIKIHDNVEVTKATGSEIDDKVNEPGPIFLQGDHGWVAFRNLQIRELPDGK